MYQLPSLPYLFQDLEPFIDTHTLGLHYHKHEQNYLNKLNELLIKNNFNFKYNLSEIIYHINEFQTVDQNDILYNLGGILNHNLYWKSMNPNPKNPVGNLAKALKTKFKNMEQFLIQFKNMALKIKGSGYTFLVLKNDGQLEIINVPNQTTPLSLGYIPLFNIDMWEHAYYLNYQNDKEKYIDNFIKIADFTNASRIYNDIFK